MLPGAASTRPNSLTAFARGSASSFCSSSITVGHTVTSEVESTTASASRTSALRLLSGCSAFPLLLRPSTRKCCTASCRLFSDLRTSEHAKLCAAEFSPLHGCTRRSKIVPSTSGETSSASSSIVPSTFVASSSTSELFAGLTPANRTSKSWGTSDSPPAHSKSSIGTQSPMVATF